MAVLKIVARNSNNDPQNDQIHFLDGIWNIFHYRDLIIQLVRCDLIVRYKRSVLGILWTLLNPLALMIVLTLAFSNIFGTTKSYAGYVLTGLMAWNFFSQATTQAMNKIVWGGNILRKIYLPPTVFAISATGTALINLLISLIPLGIIYLVSGVKISWTILLAPLPIFLLALYTLGVGLIISTVAVYFPDVVDMYGVLLIIWMYLSPVIYLEEVLSPVMQFWLHWLNPLYSLIHVFRLILYDGALPGFYDLIPAIVYPVLTFVIGWILFTKKAEEFAYLI